MNRRNFTRVFSLGGILLTVPTLSFSRTASEQQPQLSEWLQRFGFQPAYPTAAARLIREQASHRLQPANGLTLRYGRLYRRPGSSAYAMPVYLQTADKVHLYSYILYWDKSSTGNIHIFDEYQVRALNHASRDLDKQGCNSLAETLLPIDQTSSHLQGYRTRKGVVGLRTAIKNQGVCSTEIKIRIGDHWQQDRVIA